MSERINSSVGISPDYVSEWSVEEGIREIVQNVIDAEKEFDCDIEIQYNGNVSVVRDYGPGLELKHLVMGVSEKGSKSIGQFGEGLKLALLVFAREGRKIKIHSRDKVIVPVINYSEQFETDLITLDISETDEYIQGTKIVFESTEQELEEGKNYFLRFYRKDNNNFNWIDDDFVSRPGGSIWVNGSKVGEVKNSEFSYHLTSNEAKDTINRDRGMVDRDELEDIIVQKLGKTRSVTLMKEVLKLVKNNEQCFETDLDFYGWRIGSRNKKLWKRAKTKVFGKKVVLAGKSNTANKQAEYKGYEVVNIEGYNWRDLLGDIGVKKAETAIREKTKMIKIAQKRLTETEYNNLKKAKKLVRDNYNDTGRVKIVKKFKSDQDILGQYNRAKDVIYLHRKVLTDLRDAVDTLLHEAVHKHSGASDCTEEFEDALCKVAVDIMLK